MPLALARRRPVVRLIIPSPASLSGNRIRCRRPAVLPAENDVAATACITAATASTGTKLPVRSNTDPATAGMIESAGSRRTPSSHRPAFRSCAGQNIPPTVIHAIELTPCPAADATIRNQATRSPCPIRAAMVQRVTTTIAALNSQRGATHNAASPIPKRAGMVAK